MSQILTDFSEQSLADAVDASHIGFFQHIGRGGELREGSDMVQFVTGLPHPIFNGVMHARLAPGALDDRIEAAMAPYRERQIPMFWWTGPLTRPEDLGTYLQARGLRHAGDMPGMAVDLRTLPEQVPTSPGFTIETVVDREGLREWGLVTNRSFEVPVTMDQAWLDYFWSLGVDLPVRYYLGRWIGQPVASSALGLFAGAAGLYAVATVAEARRQGFGAAVTLAPLLEARRMGYQIGTLSASPMGFRVYHHLGFRQCCKLGLYAWPNDPTSDS